MPTYDDPGSLTEPVEWHLIATDYRREMRDPRIDDAAPACSINLIIRLLEAREEAVKRNQKIRIRQTEDGFFLDDTPWSLFPGIEVYPDGTARYFRGEE